MLLTSRRRTRAATLLTALTLIATPVVASGSAHAASWSHKDARGDVMRMSIADDGTVVKDPTDKATDITRISVTEAQKLYTLAVQMETVAAGGTDSSGIALAAFDDPA